MSAEIISRMYTVAPGKFYAGPIPSSPDAGDIAKVLEHPIKKWGGHCWGGLGRTGAVVGCWLRRHGEKDPLKKLQELRVGASNSHRASPQSEDQYSLVRNWLPER